MTQETRRAVTSPGELSPLERENVEALIGNYRRTLLTPLHLMNHTSILTYGSDQESVDERSEALRAYLYRQAIPDVWVSRDDVTPQEGKALWGRTIVAEMVARSLIEETFRPILDRMGLRVALAPIEMDHSVYHWENPNLQKGADICFISPLCDGTSPDGSDTVWRAVGGTDVTLGSKDTVKAKRNRPGIQLPLAMWVNVIPLRDLYFGKDKQTFPVYLDKVVRAAILRGEEYVPFMGFDGDLTRWKWDFAERFRNSMQMCRDSLRQTKDRRVKGYPYLSETYQQLDIMRLRLEEYMRHLTVSAN